MRIVSGQFRGKPLVAPEGRDGVRPTSDRTRESVFNVLMHNYFGSLDGVRVADLFAGTGALGLEALSRGASFATFVERHGSALTALRQNIASLKLERRCRVAACDATALPVAATTDAYGLVFLDPPYELDAIAPALRALVGRRWLAEGAIVVCEHSFNHDLTAPESFTQLDERRYGKAKVTFLRYGGPSAA